MVRHCTALHCFTSAVCIAHLSVFLSVLCESALVSMWMRSQHFKQCCGSMTIWCGSGFGSGSCYFRHRPSRCLQKTKFKKSFSAYYFLKVHFSYYCTYAVNVSGQDFVQRDHFESLKWPHFVKWGFFHNFPPHLQHRDIGNFMSPDSTIF